MCGDSPQGEADLEAVLERISNSVEDIVADSLDLTPEQDQKIAEAAAGAAHEALKRIF